MNQTTLGVSGVSSGCVIAPNDGRGVSDCNFIENKEQEWITPVEARKLTGLSRSTIHRRCVTGEFVTQKTMIPGGLGHLILKSSLPLINNDLADTKTAGVSHTVAGWDTQNAPNVPPQHNINKKQTDKYAKTTLQNGENAPQNECKRTVKYDDTPAKWLSKDDVLAITQWSERTFQRRCSAGEVYAKIDGNSYIVHIDSLPVDARADYYSRQIDNADQKQYAKEAELEMLNAAPDYNRRLAYKYLSLFRAVEGLKGADLHEFIKTWNAKNTMRTSYNMILTKKREYKDKGIIALLGRWGTNKGRTTVEDECFDYFKRHYMTQGAEKAHVVWKKTRGYAKTVLGLDIDDFPCPQTFVRRLNVEVGESAVYLARYGQQAWNRKFGYYIDRDMNMKAGTVWVSDHMQADAIVFDDEVPIAARRQLAHLNGKRSGKNRKTGRPWITVWRDMRTGKWLGWYIHMAPPNTDHILQAMYNAMTRYGIPTHIYIDNGKDYRAKYFTGGREYTKRFTLNVDEPKVTAMTAILGIIVIFAKPYGPQTKPVERDFKNVHAWYERALPGYTGSTTNHRPEDLDKQIKKGEILEFHDYVILAEFYIENIINKTKSKGKHLQNLSPDEAWSHMFEGLPTINADELKLYCMRLSSTRKIGRSGWKDPEIGLYYYAEWMVAYFGQSVYVRRDPKRYQTAWFYSAETDEFLGLAPLQMRTPAVAMNDIERERVTAANKEKARAQRLIKDAAGVGAPDDVYEQALHFAAGLEQTEEADNNAHSNTVRVTPAAAAIEKAEEMRKTGTWDTPIAPYEPDDDKQDKPKRIIRLFDN